MKPGEERGAGGEQKKEMDYGSRGLGGGNSLYSPGPHYATCSRKIITSLASYITELG